MRTLLVITSQPSLAAALQAALDRVRFQIIPKEVISDAGLLLSRGAIDAAILDVDLNDVRAMRSIQEIQSHAPTCAVIIYTNTRQTEWEEDAYLLGVAHVLSKPVRG